MMMADGLIPTRVRTFAVRGQALNCKNLPLHQTHALPVVIPGLTRNLCRGA